MIKFLKDGLPTKVPVGEFASKETDIMEVDICKKRPHSSTEEETEVIRDRCDGEFKNMAKMKKINKKKVCPSSGTELLTTNKIVDLRGMMKLDKYDAFSRGPFIVLFRMNTIRNGNEPIKSLPMLSATQKLNNINIKFDRITRYSFNTWQVTFSSKSAANAALSNPLLPGSGFVAFIPRYKLSRKGVIREIPEDFSLEELKNIIEEENSNLLITNIFRFKRRNRITKLLENSQSVCLEFRGEKLPDSIHILRTINPVVPYVSSVRLCFKCGRIGDISKLCERPERCLTCGKEHIIQKGNKCEQPANCINCKGADRKSVV